MLVQLKTAVADANRFARQLKLPSPLQLELNLEQIKAESIGLYGDQLYVNFDALGTSKVSF
ncbi:MAG: hypothetical protein JO170_12450 [Verrucomicrobia bacterium]|nr:hypothetical protein [Verrucomicrobiota bacterium]